MKALLLTLLTVPAFAQVEVHYPLSETACPQPAIILPPCQPSGLALCLYPVNPGGTMAGSNIYADTAFACSDNGLVYQGSGDEVGILFGVQAFGTITITEVQVDYSGDPLTVTSDHGDPPFVQQGVAQFTIHNEGTSVIHSITVISQINTDIPEYVENVPPKPRIWIDPIGRIHPYRLKRRP